MVLEAEILTYVIPNTGIRSSYSHIRIHFGRRDKPVINRQTSHTAQHIKHLKLIQKIIGTRIKVSHTHHYF